MGSKYLQKVRKQSNPYEIDSETNSLNQPSEQLHQSRHALTSHDFRSERKEDKLDSIIKTLRMMQK